MNVSVNRWSCTYAISPTGLLLQSPHSGISFAASPSRTCSPLARNSVGTLYMMRPFRSCTSDTSGFFAMLILHASTEGKMLTCRS